MRVAIVGGGIAGLAAAYELDLARRAGIDVDYELFEAGDRFGGVISSTMFEGTVIEHGPDSFLTEKPAAAQLCRELGLESQFVPSDDAKHTKFWVVPTLSSTRMSLSLLGHPVPLRSTSAPETPAAGAATSDAL